jgi:Type II secretion system (T2SS), protein G
MFQRKKAILAIWATTIAGCGTFLGTTVDIIPPRDMTVSTLDVTYYRIEAFWNRHGRVPANVGELLDENRDCSMKDGWGRELQWLSEGTTKVTVRSLGRDGKPGGTDEDADLEVVFLGRQKDQHDLPTIKGTDVPR